jgi:DNA repair photolyase
MELLLENDVSLLISTKSRIPDAFLDLFVRHPGKVHVQVGLTTISDRVRELLEPHAAGIADRLHTLRALVDRGVKAEARGDPLIPELTDSQESFESLCRTISECGARSLAASYLFLRRGNYRAMNVEIEGWSFQDMAGRLYTDQIENYCGGGSIRIPDRGYRRIKYAQMKDIAEKYGLKLHLCRCKNPDLISKCCHPQPSTNHGQGVQTDLFDS